MRTDADEQGVIIIDNKLLKNFHEHSANYYLSFKISTQIAVLNRFNTIHEKMYNRLIRKVSHLHAFSMYWVTLKKAVKLFPISTCTFKRKLKVLFPWVASAEAWFELLHWKTTGWQTKGACSVKLANPTIWNACTKGENIQW